jgi:hypothetical protein
MIDNNDLATTAAADDLCMTIINLPCEVAPECLAHQAAAFGYKPGHQAARNAASALVGRYQAVSAQPASDDLRNQVLEEAIAVVPGGSYCDPQQVADAIRALKKNTTKGE